MYHGRSGRRKPLRGTTKAVINYRTPKWQAAGGWQNWSLSASGPYQATIYGNSASGTQSANGNGGDSYQYSEYYQFGLNGQWQATSGSGSAAGGESLASGYAASGGCSNVPAWVAAPGSAWSGSVSAAANSGTSYDYSTNSTFTPGSGSGSGWTSTGSASCTVWGASDSSFTASSPFSSSGAYGGGGSIPYSGTASCNGGDNSSFSYTQSATLQADGSWAAASGSGSTSGGTSQDWSYAGGGSSSQTLSTASVIDDLGSWTESQSTTSSGQTLAESGSQSFSMGYGTTATLASGASAWVQSGSGSASGNASYYASYTAWGSGSDETDAVSGGAEGVIVNITSNASAGDMSESNVASGTSNYSDTMTLAGGVWTDDPSLSASTSSQSGYTSANTSSNSFDEPGMGDHGGYSSGNVTSNAIVTTTSNYNFNSGQWSSTTALSGSGQANWTSGAYYNNVYYPSEDTWSQVETNSSWSPLGSGTAVSETVSSTYAGYPAPDPAYSSSSAQYSLADFSQTGGLWVSGYPFELPTLGTSSGLTTGGTGFPGSGQTLGSIPAVPAIVSNFGTPTLPGAAGVTLLLSATPDSLAGLVPSPVLVAAEWGMAFTPQTVPQTAFAVGNTAGAAAGFTSETMVGAGGVFGGNNVAVVVPVTRAGAVVNYGDYGVSAGNPAEGGGVSGDDDYEGESDDASAGLGGDSADFASLGSQSQGGIAPVTSAIQAHPVSLTDADGGVTNFAYNSSSDLTSLTDPDGTTTTWTLNSQNDVTQETDGQGNSTSFTYNSSNQLTSYTDADGNVRTYQYDSAGQVITETLYATAADAVAGQNAEDTLHYSYDSSGNMTSESDDDSSDTYTYDSQNRLTSVTETSVDAPTVVLTYQYAATGTQPTGVSATIDGVADYQDAYTYNSQGQLTAITRTGQSGGDAVADETIDLTYNAAGQVETIDRYQGGQLAVEADYSYDSAGRLVGLVYEQGTTVLASYSYSYAAAAESGEAAAASTPSPWLPGGAMLPATSVQSIDTAGLDQAISPEQLVAGVTSLDGSVAYSYDAEGQLTAATYSGSSVQPNESYFYDANGDRTSSTSSAAVVIGADNEVLFDGTYTYTYDADGNETAKFIDVHDTGVLAAGDTGLTQYTWDAGNRLVRVTTSASYGGTPTQTVVYLYDAEGRWIGENVENASGLVTHETRFVYDGNQIVLQFDENLSGGTGSVTTMTAADLSHRYLWGSATDQLLSDEQLLPSTSGGGAGGEGYDLTQPGTVVLPLTDNLGTVRDLAICDLTSGTTTVVNHLDYNSFGVLLSQTNPPTGNIAAVDCLFGFTGRAFDTNTGLQNNDNRWYNASVGRWESPDPDGFTAGDTNEYRYCDNSPANATDPTGLEWSNQAAEKRIKALAEQNAKLIESLRKSNKNDPRLLFLEIQQRILEKLLQDDHFAKDAQAAGWLANVLTVFMKSLLNAVDENIAGVVKGRLLVPTPDNAIPNFLDGKQAGPWWYDWKGEADDQVHKSMTNKLSLQTRQEVWAIVMAKIHILFDLYYALLYNGAGTDSDWNLIGQYVSEAASEVGGRWGLTQKTGETLGIIPDILKMRKEMRDRAKKKLKEHGIDPEKNPYDHLNRDQLRNEYRENSHPH